MLNSRARVASLRFSDASTEFHRRPGSLTQAGAPAGARMPEARSMPRFRRKS
jgi:hypothetical protein